jgi:hypothetical protein
MEMTVRPSRPSLVLAQRAASEGPRWTRAVQDSLSVLEVE